MFCFKVAGKAVPFQTTCKAARDSGPTGWPEGRGDPVAGCAFFGIELAATLCSSESYLRWFDQHLFSATCCPLFFNH